MRRRPAWPGPGGTRLLPGPDLETSRRDVPRALLPELGRVVLCSVAHSSPGADCFFRCRAGSTCGRASAPRNASKLWSGCQAVFLTCKTAYIRTAAAALTFSD